MSTANPQIPLEADVLCAGMRGYRDVVVTGVATSGRSHHSNIQLRYFPWTASFSLVSLSIYFSVSMNLVCVCVCARMCVCMCTCEFAHCMLLRTTFLSGFPLPIWWVLRIQLKPSGSRASSPTADPSRWPFICFFPERIKARTQGNKELF